MNEYIVVNFSGGKDSTAMLLRMIELGEHIDEVVCCDTYKEFPAMYRHIAKVKKVVQDAGIKFTELRSEETFDYMMYEHRKTRGKHTDRIGLGWPTPVMRWCTGALKRDINNAYFREMRKKHVVTQCLGLAADEQYRFDRPNNQLENKKYPLVEWGWTEADCLKYCYSQGYDWEGLYEIFERVSCWCCPFKTLPELRKLRKHCPDLWEELRDMDRRAWNNFRNDYTVEELEKRFAFEEERVAAGLPITGREFHRELRKRLGK